MSYEVERIELDEGVSIRIVQDEHPSNPRGDAECLGWMFTCHRDYFFGYDKWDEQFENDFSWTCPRCDGNGEVESVVADDEYYPCSKCEGDGNIYPHSLEDIANYLRTERDAIVVLPLVVYDHSGVTMKVGKSFAGDPQGWDTSNVGFIYTTQERVDELGVPQDDIEKQLIAEVEEYDQYGTGDVYGFIIDTPTEKHADSCWGFYGTDYIKEEARASAQCFIDDIQTAKRRAKVALATRERELVF